MSSNVYIECVIEAPEVVGHGEDLGSNSKPLKDFKQSMDGV